MVGGSVVVGERERGREREDGWRFRLIDLVGLEVCL